MPMGGAADITSIVPRHNIFKGTMLWDNLPLDVINLLTLGEFKAKIRGLFSPFDETLS